MTILDIWPAPVTLIDLPANPATPSGIPGENFPAGPDRDGSWVPGPFQVRIEMEMTSFFSNYNALLKLI